MRTIVVGVQTGPARDAALDFGVAEALRRRLPLHVVHAFSVPVYAELPSVLLQRTVREARQAAERLTAEALEGALQRQPSAGGLVHRTSVVESDAAAALLVAAEPAALLVVGRRGGGSAVRGLRGSVSTSCLHGTQTPVAVVPPRSEPVPDRWLRSRVVAALDGSPASLTALSWAVSQAREWGCPLVPVVVSLPGGARPGGLQRDERGEPDDLADVVAQHVRDAGGAGLEVRPRLLVGHPSAELVAVLTPQDLLVTGSRGRSGLAGLMMGSTSTTLAERGPCPVVVVRAGQARREIHQRASEASAGLAARDLRH